MLRSVERRMTGALVGGILASVAVSAPSSAGWKVVSVSVAQEEGMDGEAKRQLRIGVQNRSNEIRGVCLVGWGYSLEEGRETSTAAGGSSHSCSAREAAALVRPGETHFLTIPVELDGVRRPDSTKLVVQLELMEARMGEEGRETDLELKWIGKVRDALTGVDAEAKQ